jgi:2,3-dihydroxybenzoate decarboxylase
MLGKIALEEAWSTPEALASSGLVTSLAPKGVIGPDLVASLLDVHGTRLQQMDANGVDLMVLSLSSPGPQGVADPGQAEALAAAANDCLADEVAKNPARFAGMVSVSMHNPAQAAAEVRRCVVGGGNKGRFVGVIVNDYQSVLVSSKDGDGGGKGKIGMRFYDVGTEYDEFWRAAEELDLPVYIHPREATPEVFDLMWKDRPWLAYSALGYAHRVGMHVLGIVTSGVLDRFPKLKIVIGHMGEHM